MNLEQIILALVKMNNGIIEIPPEYLERDPGDFVLVNTDDGGYMMLKLKNGAVFESGSWD